MHFRNFIGECDYYKRHPQAAEAARRAAAEAAVKQ